MLKDLLIDESKIDEGLLEKILSPFVRIGKEKGTVRFTTGAVKLGIKEKVVLFLVAQKTKKLLGFKGIEEKTSPRQIEKELGVKGSSLRPILKRLREAGLIRSHRGNYLVENHTLPEIEKLFRNYTKGGG